MAFGPSVNALWHEIRFKPTAVPNLKKVNFDIYSGLAEETLAFLLDAVNWDGAFLGFVLDPVCSADLVANPGEFKVTNEFPADAFENPEEVQLFFGQQFYKTSLHSCGLRSLNAPATIAGENSISLAWVPGNQSVEAIINPVQGKFLCYLNGEFNELYLPKLSREIYLLLGLRYIPLTNAPQLFLAEYNPRQGSLANAIMNRTGVSRAYCDATFIRLGVFHGRTINSKYEYEVLPESNLYQLRTENSIYIDKIYQCLNFVGDLYEKLSPSMVELYN